jgi:hypothetical protein
VIAPSLIPVMPGVKVKTDLRDARRLAHLYRAGELAERERRARSNGPVTLLAVSGFCSRFVVKACRDYNVRHSITAPQNSGVKGRSSRSKRMLGPRTPTPRTARLGPPRPDMVTSSNSLAWGRRGSMPDSRRNSRNIAVRLEHVAMGEPADDLSVFVRDNRQTTLLARKEDEKCFLKTLVRPQSRNRAC